MSHKRAIVADAYGLLAIVHGQNADNR